METDRYLRMIRVEKPLCIRVWRNQQPFRTTTTDLLTPFIPSLALSVFPLSMAEVELEYVVGDRPPYMARQVRGGVGGQISHHDRPIWRVFRDDFLHIVRSVWMHICLAWTLAHWLTAFAFLLPIIRLYVFLPSLLEGGTTAVPRFKAVSFYP